MLDECMTEDEVLSYCSDDFARAWRSWDTVHSLLDQFVDATVLVVVHDDATASFLLGDEGFDRFFGVDSAIDVENFFMRVRRLDRRKFMMACKEAVDTGECQHLEISWVNVHSREASKEAKDNLVDTEMTIQLVGNHDGEPILFFAIHDIDAIRRRRRELLRSQLSSLRALFSEIFAIDLDTGESEPIWLEGRSVVDDSDDEATVSLHTVFSSVHPDDVQLFWKNSNYSYIRESLFGNSPRDALTFDLRRREGDGDYHWTRMFITRLENAVGHAMVLVCSQNIDAQMEAQRRERELMSRAQCDSLTGVYNRGTSEELISSRMQSLGQDECALFSIIDIDNFKQVNDTFGHQMGDEAIKLVAESLQGICREEDVVGRFGGDEFVMLLIGTELPDERKVKERFAKCKEQICKKSQEFGIDPPVTVSVGAICIAASDDTYHNIFRAADHLLYEVKREGKDGFRYARFNET